MPDNRSTYPNFYEELYPLDRSISFISPHINHQSVIYDPETGARKCPIVPKFTDKDRVKTVKDIFEYGLKASDTGTNVCFGKRPSFSSPVSWLTYAEVDKRVKAIGSSLSRLRTLENDREKFVGIYGPNSPETPLPTDLYMIAYTSGSTGLPKGVLVSHGEVAYCTISLLETSEFKLVSSNAVHFSYLPLPHSMEQIALSAHIMMGGSAGFLTQTVDNLIDDAQVLRPTSLVMVPRVLSRLYTKYQQALGDSMVKQRLYNHIVKRKLAEQKRGKFYHKSIVDTMLFGKLRKKLGGRVCCIVTGGAPISLELEKFAHALFGMVFQGYGSTESLACITLSRVGEYRLGTVGGIGYGMKVKLVDVPELGLIVSRDRRGEICCKGKHCTKGYYKDPVKTAELIDNDGWLHTGDIGEWMPVSLKILSDIHLSVYLFINITQCY
ncbi:unnamed protein product [Schistosoma turkestanicum]|nr:unnamed protein product [Schistosoma turkestanicum]